ncbi:MAG: FAD-dependent oxidoreductase [Chromatiaceae bacterium]|jgi:predicted NAD/FAD-binding protein|nr:FAD-dependent oxidoreductase [Chromatiaceae bacterium]
MGQHIAVIGTGIAGLASAWLLAREHRVTLLERNDYVGGHTHTVEVDEGGRRLPVDTGFIVYNERNYPLLTRLFAHLGVATQDTDMSFAASIGPGRLEYSGSDLDGLFAQRRNLLRPGFLRMLWDIQRFNRRCHALLGQPDGLAELSLGDFLERERLGTAFRDHYLLPMAAAIWSCPTATMLDFPAESLARFFANHGLLDLHNRPQWKTVTGGSQVYARRLVEDLGADNLVHDAVRAVQREDSGVTLRLASGASARFDQVVLACHADEALGLIGDPTADERRLLSAFAFQTNEAWLHTDEALMPRSRRVWSSWNYLARPSSDGGRAVSVSYWMNRLQRLATQRDYFVSLNPLESPREDRVIARMTYEHPVFDRGAVEAQTALPQIQGRDLLWFAGAWTGYGFHEDGLRSAVAVAEGLGVHGHPLSAPEPIAAVSGTRA